MKLVPLDPLALMECVTSIAKLVLSFIHCCSQAPVLGAGYSPNVAD